MSVGYTPGPWVYWNDPYDNGTPYMRLSAGETMKDDVSDGFSIAGIVHPNDAHLIAAAPELLEALAGVMDILGRAESNASGNPEWDYVGPRIAATRAAIAKATGA